MLLIQIHTTTRINHLRPNILSITIQVTQVTHQILRIIQMDLILTATQPITILIQPLLIVLVIHHLTKM